MDSSVFGGLTWQMIILAGLSLSLGWGIRGNFGHEAGAAIPGALAAMSIAIMSGRPDWWPRIAYFAMFGGLGWSFGGSMSYMQVIGYTHSGHSPSILYGYANVFVIGFLWAAIGGAGTALPAFLGNGDLSLFFVPILAAFIAWALRTIFVDMFFRRDSMRRHESRLYWYDTDWLAALTAMIAALVVVIFRRGFDMATSLIIYMTVGWFSAFLLLVNLLKIRMTPPRGDNWAGCVGMVAGLLVYCWRFSLGGLAFAMLATGFIGGIGYALAQLFKLILIRTGLQTNWHSVLEQTQGLFHGIGLAVAMGLVAASAPRISDTPPMPAWNLIFAVIFVLVLLTYMNHRKATATWVEQVKSLPDRPYGIPVSSYLPSSRWYNIGWFELVYIAIGISIIWAMLVYVSNPLPSILFIPDNWLGKGQLLYLIFLWWVIIFNFERALVAFTPQRLITEGVITFNGIICTILVSMGIIGLNIPEPVNVSYAGWIGKTAIIGLVAAISMALMEWGVTYWIYGKSPAPGAGLNIRFGPKATATKAKPKTGEQHP